MDIILTHEQADFDAAGSVLAAWLLDPARMPVLPKRRNRNLSVFLEDYKSRLPFFTWQTLPKGPIDRVYITDTQSVEPNQRLNGVKDVVVWDHHPHRHIFPDRDENIYETTGACTTFLVEKLSRVPNCHPGRIYATLMLLGIYEDTGYLSYGSISPRDIRAAAWLVENGADLDLLRHYLVQPLSEHQQRACELLLQNCETHEIMGEKIITAYADVREVYDAYSAVAHELRDMLSPDGLILMLGTKAGVRLICRATNDDIDFSAMMKDHFDGGGHPRAASGVVPVEDTENTDITALLLDVKKDALAVLPDYIAPPRVNLWAEMEEKIPPDRLSLIKQVSETAEALHMPAYIVGGVVRDLLLDRPVMDFDVVVEGDAIQLAKALKERYGGSFVFHNQFFTAKWTPSEGPSLDLISARSETYPEPASLPVVSMSTLADDLARRDFTINTLAVRLDGSARGDVVDHCGGIPDLRRKLIRTLHERSFIDDPTRMFRAVRFEQRFDFMLEQETLCQLRSQLSGISSLTGQRIWHELKLYCAEPCPEDLFSRLVHLGMAAYIHPALGWNERIAADCVRFQDPEGIRALEAALPNEAAERIRTEALLWVWFSSYSDAVIDELGERLLLSRKTLNCIHGLASLRKNMTAYREAKDSEICFFLDTLPVESVSVYGCISADASEVRAIRTYLSVWRRLFPETNGDKLTKMGIAPGPEMREILSALRAALIDGVLCSAAEEIEFIENFRRSGN